MKSVSEEARSRFLSYRWVGHQDRPLPIDTQYYLLMLYIGQVLNINNHSSSLIMNTYLMSSPVPEVTLAIPYRSLTGGMVPSCVIRGDSIMQTTNSRKTFISYRRADDTENHTIEAICTSMFREAKRSQHAGYPALPLEDQTLGAG